ncbi:MAG: hypothetical protein LQ344_000482 [Seirophora lacunosa]|nr:MAG: hypothetical protein LQ344_000482 [Seirophora lacunosa]
MDDFYMPEVVSPAPKRVIPEMPDNIQENIGRVELDGTTAPIHRLSGMHPPSPIVETPGSAGRQSRNSAVSTLSAPTELDQSSGFSNVSMKQLPQPGISSDQPSFSPFPRLQHRPHNVPPSDEEKEVILENARVPVLNSTDPEMQLSWAQDALVQVEIAAQDASKVIDRQATRPPTPRTEHQLRVDAVNVVSFLADQHHPKAEFMRGMWLEFGKFGFRMDKKEAYRCYSRASQKGYARAEYRMGMQFESSNDPVNAIKHYSLGVDADDSASNYRLGMMTLLGQHGQQLDYRRGIDLIRRAAETADENAPQGAYVYGMLLARELKQIPIPDQMLPLDLNAARFNIEKAAYHGFAKAQTKMGAAYELCQLGCDFDPALSLHYNALASRQREPEADMAISKWFLCGHKGIFERNDELAFVYAARAAQTGLPTAEFAMGYFYEVGIHVSSDLSVAKSWYSKAADHGYAEAAGRIDGISRSDTLSKKDHQEIAIARIRSMHGSQRGKRPNRARPNEQMPTIPSVSQNPPAFQTMKPYPEDRRPYASPSVGNLQRPVSTAPYPEDSGFRGTPGLRLNNAANYSAPDLGIRPDLRPASVNAVPSASAAGPKMHPSATSMRPPRSFSNQDPFSGGRGRGAQPYRVGNGASGAPGYRQPSSGLNNVQSLGSPLGTPVSAYPPSPQMNSPQLSSTPASNIDIGFSAPLDPSGADRRGRLQKSGNRPGGGVGPGPSNKPLPSQTAQTAPGQRNPDRVSSVPDTQCFTRPSRTASPRGQAHSRPGSSAGVRSPGGTAVSSPNGALAPSLPPKVPVTLGPAPTPPPNSTSRLPGKGPKTFEEMGVPAQKQKDECPPNTESKTAYYTKDTRVNMNDAVAAEKHIGYLQQQIETARGYERLLKAKLAALRARPSINEVRVDITTLELEKSELTDRLERLRSWKTKAVPLAEKEAADKAWAEWKRKAESRRRIFVEMWAVVVDGLSEGGLTKEVLWEELGLEKDED